MKASRFLLLCLVASTACIPASGMSPSQTVIANPDPQLAGASPATPFVTRQTERSASELAASPAMRRASKKTWLYVAGGAAALIVVILLVSGGGSSGY